MSSRQCSMCSFVGSRLDVHYAKSPLCRFNPPGECSPSDPTSKDVPHSLHRPVSHRKRSADLDLLWSTPGPIEHTQLPVVSVPSIFSLPLAPAVKQTDDESCSNDSPACEDLSESTDNSVPGLSSPSLASLAVGHSHSPMQHLKSGATSTDNSYPEQLIFDLVPQSTVGRHCLDSLEVNLGPSRLKDLLTGVGAVKFPLDEVHNHVAFQNKDRALLRFYDMCERAGTPRYFPNLVIDLF